MVPPAKNKIARKSKSPKAGKKRLAINSASGATPSKKKRVSFGSAIETNSTKKNVGILKKKRNESKADDANTPKKAPEPFSKEISKKSGGFRTGSKVSEKMKIMTRKDRKSYLNKLKANKRPNYELSQKAKSIWEKLRNYKSDCSTKTRLSQELYGLVEGKAKELIFAHDTVRVMQCLLALKNVEIRTKLFEELKDEILTMSKKKYAKFFVIKMLKYGTPAQRLFIMKSFFGHVPDLVKHTVAMDVVEYAYNEYANALQRCQLASEFYGNEFQIFKVEEPITLKEYLLKEPKKKDAVLQTLFDHLSAIAEKPVMKSTLVHRLVLDFFENCTDDRRDNLIDSLKDRTIEMAHTRDGALASMYCLWYGTVKDRKAIVKSLKDFVVKICIEEHGHLFLLALFDAVDDTVLVGKIVLKEIKKNLKEILANKYGLKVIEYLMSPRDSRYFTKQVVSVFAAGDQQTESKKSRETKSEELLKIISPALLQYAEENARQMIFDSHSCLFLNLVLEKTVGDKKPVYEAICQVLTDEFIPCNSENLHMVEHPHGHFVLKQLIKRDKLLYLSKNETLSEVMIEQLSDVHFSSWLTCNKGGFILVHMLESDIPAVIERIKTIVEKSKKKLKKYTFSSAKLLLSKLN